MIYLKNNFSYFQYDGCGFGCLSCNGSWCQLLCIQESLLCSHEKVVPWNLQGLKSSCHVSKGYRVKKYVPFTFISIWPQKYYTYIYIVSVFQLWVLMNLLCQNRLFHYLFLSENKTYGSSKLVHLHFDIISSICFRIKCKSFFISLNSSNLFRINLKSDFIWSSLS